MKTTEVAAAWQVELANTAECGEFTNSRELVRMRTQGCSSILYVYSIKRFQEE